MMWKQALTVSYDLLQFAIATFEVPPMVKQKSLIWKCPGASNVLFWSCQSRKLHHHQSWWKIMNTQLNAEFNFETSWSASSVCIYEHSFNFFHELYCVCGFGKPHAVSYHEQSCVCGNGKPHAVSLELCYVCGYAKPHAVSFEHSYMNFITHVDLENHLRLYSIYLHELSYVCGYG